MKTKSKVLLPALFLASPLLLAATPALAVQPITTPWGTAPVNVFIGNRADLSEMIAVYQNANTLQCQTRHIGQANKPDDSTNLFGGPGDDAIYVAWVNLSPCGINIVPPIGPNGPWIDIRGNGGNDTIANPDSSFQTNLFGGDGNDHIFSYQTNVIMDGEAGEDAVGSESSGGAEAIYGGAGQDCLYDSNSSASVFDCGPESHEYKVSGQFPVNSASCEIAVSACF